MPIPFFFLEAKRGKLADFLFVFRGGAGSNVADAETRKEAALGVLRALVSGAGTRVLASTRALASTRILASTGVLPCTSFIWSEQ